MSYFIKSWFPLFPTPPSPALCYICLLFPFQSYLVGVGPCGSLSHPPPTGRRMSLPCPPMLLGECNACIRESKVHKAFSLSELPPGMELQTICFELPWLSTFAVEASVLSTWTPQCMPQKDSKDQRLISFQIDWFVSLLYKGLSRIFSSTTVQKLNF